jgi:hypothetical protein
MRVGKGRRAEKRLVRETEALLTGRARIGFIAAGLSIPVWAEINWLAHANPSEIVSLARDELSLKGPDGSWAWAISTVARELFRDAGAKTDTIRRLQCDCIIPMEISLMREVPEQFLPIDFVSLGLLRIRAHPSACGGPPPGATNE